MTTPIITDMNGVYKIITHYLIVVDMNRSTSGRNGDFDFARIVPSDRRSHYFYTGGAG